MNFYHTLWALVCMSPSGFVPPNSYIFHHYIFIIDLELNP